MLRVVCMALMNVIPVVASIFGAAYAVQAAYGIGFQKTFTFGFRFWVISWRCSSFPMSATCRTKSAAGPDHCRCARFGAARVRYLYAISIHSVPLAIVMSLLMWACLPRL